MSKNLFNIAWAVIRRSCCLSRETVLLTFTVIKRTCSLSSRSRRSVSSSTIQLWARVRRRSRVKSISTSKSEQVVTECKKLRQNSSPSSQSAICVKMGRLYKFLLVLIVQRHLIVTKTNIIRWKIRHTRSRSAMQDKAILQRHTHKHKCFNIRTWALQWRVNYKSGKAASRAIMLNRIIMGTRVNRAGMICRLNSGRRMIWCDRPVQCKTINSGIKSWTSMTIWSNQIKSESDHRFNSSTTQPQILSKTANSISIIFNNSYLSNSSSSSSNSSSSCSSISCRNLRQSLSSTWLFWRIVVLNWPHRRQMKW